MRRPAAWALLSLGLLLARLLFGASPAPSVEDRLSHLETSDAWQSTQLAALGVLAYTPTPEGLPPHPTATATLAPTATPDPYQRACVRPGINLNVRSSPGGAVIDQLPGGTYVRYLPQSAKEARGWRYVKLDTTGLPGQPDQWVAIDYLIHLEPSQPCPTA